MCGGCWLLLGCLFPVCQTNRLVCLLLPPTLMLPLIVLICPWTQRLEELSCTSELLWPSLCTCSVGLQSPEPNRHGVARPVGAWQPDNGVMSFFSPLTHPLRMMYMWLIFLLPLSLTCFRCSALSRTESRLDQCIVFLFQSHSSELKTRKVTQVRFGRVWKQSSASGGPLKAGVWVCLGCLCVRACMHVCGGEKRSERKTNMQREVEQIHVFLTTSSSGLTSLSSCLLCASCLFFTGNHFPCLYVTLALPSHIKLQVLHKCLSSHLPLDNLQEDYSSFLCLPHKWFSETHTKAICSTTWAVGHRSRKRRLHIRHEDQSFKTHSGVSAL